MPDARGQLVFDEWDTDHPRFPEFLQFLRAVTPDQLPFVVGETYARYPSHLLVALDAGELAGAPLRGAAVDS